jgi:hypothetical protein
MRVNAARKECVRHDSICVRIYEIVYLGVGGRAIHVVDHDDRHRMLLNG